MVLGGELSSFLCRLMPSTDSTKEGRGLLKRFRKGFSVRNQGEWKPQRTFTLFLSLPPEIRERIYEICCDQDREILEQHFVATRPVPEPAIACASRLLRKEAIPVFYKHYRFPITNNPASFINKGLLSPSQQWRAARWYHRLSRDKLRMIRRLELYYYFGQFTVDFDARLNKYTLQQIAWGSQRLVDVHPQEEREQVLALVASVLDGLITSPGVGAFTAHDFDRLEFEMVLDQNCA